ncbi:MULTISPECIES: helix-turn-helix transcriptional regulator [Gammaproteobacteria]|uniref:helix-turn-helix domain-containing protein n=1 Tax=Gammaproteobacteria TaxID=1236 RepID=UPI000DD057F1|nr:MULTISPECIES: helix-turn-helix transcriptional regulator [Gammaproteobacteria]RTE87479.1 XRE family transcriptional regulator [Aliidiomarina sp. B3213]TCZ92737.1 XRE family transcriptional regulator [Lysobacter sp. N42]
MDKNQIKKELATQGYDLTMVAEALDKSPSLISKVVARQAKSKGVAEAIAKILGKNVEEVFPDVPEYNHEVPSTHSERASKISELRNLLGQ